MVKIKSLFILTTTIFILLSVQQTAQFVSFIDTSTITNHTQAAEPNVWMQMKEKTG